MRNIHILFRDKHKNIYLEQAKLGGFQDSTESKIGAQPLHIFSHAMPLFF
jgi:hypothetical protein